MRRGVCPTATVSPAGGPDFGPEFGSTNDIPPLLHCGHGKGVFFRESEPHFFCAKLTYFTTVSQLKKGREINKLLVFKRKMNIGKTDFRVKRSPLQIEIYIISIILPGGNNFSVWTGVNRNVSISPVKSKRAFYLVTGSPSNGVSLLVCQIFAFPPVIINVCCVLAEKAKFSFS